MNNLFIPRGRCFLPNVIATMSISIEARRKRLQLFEADLHLRSLRAIHLRVIFSIDKVLLLEQYLFRLD